MSTQINIPALDYLLRFDSEAHEDLNQYVGEAVFEQVTDYLVMLDQTRPNKMGGERQHYYQGIADKTTLEADDEAATITLPSPFGYSLFGGTITAKDKLLTVPARTEAYGHKAGDFSDLVFGMFRTTGSKFLAQKGTGLIFFWLCDEVTKAEDPTLMPTDSEILDVAVKAVGDWWVEQVGKMV